MRTPIALVFAVSLAASGGCTETCGSPQQLNGRQFDVFVTAWEYGPADLEGFPAESSPANGEHTFVFDFASASAKGPVTVTIDGQVFEGEGSWDTLECGHFSALWAGVYQAESGASHTFSALGQFVVWPGHIDGFIDWDEAWRSADGSQVGDFSSTALLQGTGNY